MARPLTHPESAALKLEFLDFCRANGGFSYKACQEMGLHYSTFQYWYAHDEDFKESFDLLKELIKDKLETELYWRALNVRERDTPLIAMLNAKARDRGYGKEANQIINISEPYKLNETDQDLINRLREKLAENSKDAG